MTTIKYFFKFQVENNMRNYIPGSLEDFRNALFGERERGRDNYLSFLIANNTKAGLRRASVLKNSVRSSLDLFDNFISKKEKEMG